jgi:hypothetical protein
VLVPTRGETVEQLFSKLLASSPDNADAVLPMKNDAWAPR